MEAHVCRVVRVECMQCINACCTECVRAAWGARAHTQLHSWRTYTRTRARTRTHTRGAHTHVHARAHANTLVAHIHTYTRAHTHTHSWRTYTRTRARTRAHTRGAHTHVHARAHTRPMLWPVRGMLRKDVPVPVLHTHSLSLSLQSSWRRAPRRTEDEPSLSHRHPPMQRTRARKHTQGQCCGLFGVCSAKMCQSLFCQPGENSPGACSHPQLDRDPQTRRYAHSRGSSIHQIPEMPPACMPLLLSLQSVWEMMAGKLYCVREMEDPASR